MLVHQHLFTVRLDHQYETLESLEPSGEISPGHERNLEKRLGLEILKQKPVLDVDRVLGQGLPCKPEAAR